MLNLNISSPKCGVHQMGPKPQNGNFLKNVLNDDWISLTCWQNCISVIFRKILLHALEGKKWYVNVLETTFAGQTDFTPSSTKALKALQLQLQFMALQKHKVESNLQINIIISYSSATHITPLKDCITQTWTRDLHTGNILPLNTKT